MEQANIQLIPPEKHWRNKSAVVLGIRFPLTDTLARTFPYSANAFPGPFSTTLSSTSMCSLSFPIFSTEPSKVTTVAPPQSLHGIRRKILAVPALAQKHGLDPAQSPLSNPPFF